MRQHPLLADVGASVGRRTRLRRFANRARLTPERPRHMGCERLPAGRATSAATPHLWQAGRPSPSTRPCLAAGDPRPEAAPRLPLRPPRARAPSVTPLLVAAPPWPGDRVDIPHQLACPAIVRSAARSTPSIASSVSSECRSPCIVAVRSTLISTSDRRRAGRRGEPPSSVRMPVLATRDGNQTEGTVGADWHMWQRR
jgi:hypothetical protein